MSLSHTPGDFVTGYEIGSYYSPNMFLELQINVEKGLLSEESMKNFLNKELINKSKYNISLEGDIGNCIQALILKYFINKLKEYQIIQNTDLIDLKNCFTSFSKDDCVEVILNCYSSEMHMRDGFRTLEHQINSYFHAICYPTICTFGYDDKKIIINIFTIFKDLKI
jgi:hypothetical protein